MMPARDSFEGRNPPKPDRRRGSQQDMEITVDQAWGRSRDEEPSDSEVDYPIDQPFGSNGSYLHRPRGRHIPIRYVFQDAEPTREQEREVAEREAERRRRRHGIEEPVAELAPDWTLFYRKYPTADDFMRDVTQTPFPDISDQDANVTASKKETEVAAPTSEGASETAGKTEKEVSSSTSAFLFVRQQWEERLEQKAEEGSQDAKGGAEPKQSDAEC